MLYSQQLCQNATDIAFSCFGSGEEGIASTVFATQTDA
jgi:hypothetical protein